MALFKFEVKSENNQTDVIHVKAVDVDTAKENLEAAMGRLLDRTVVITHMGPADKLPDSGILITDERV